MRSDIDIGIVRDLQEKQRRQGLCAAQVPPPIAPKRPSPAASTIAEIARQAVDQAIRDAIAEETQRRRGEILALVPKASWSLEEILDGVVAASGVDRHSLASGGRKEPPIFQARWLFMYIAAALRGDLSKSDIGAALHLDRSTVIHALAHFAERRDREPLKSLCLHPAVAALLAEADLRPRK